MPNNDMQVKVSWAAQVPLLPPGWFLLFYSERDHIYTILELHRGLAFKAKCLSPLPSLPDSLRPSLAHTPSEAEYCFDAHCAWMRSDTRHLKAMTVTRTLWKMLL